VREAIDRVPAAQSLFLTSLDFFGDGVARLEKVRVLREGAENFRRERVSIVGQFVKEAHAEAAHGDRRVVECGLRHVRNEETTEHVEGGGLIGERDRAG